MIQGAFDRLDQLGVPYSLRKGSRVVDELPAGAEVDVLLDRALVPDADAAFRAAGFHHLRAPGAADHRFYVSYEDGRWKKIDIKLAGPAAGRRAGGRTWWARHLAAIAALRPLSFKRLGPVVAFLGPDGAGKGTVIAALQARVPVGLSVVYLGSRPRRRGGGPRRPSERQAGVLRESAFVLYRALHFWKILAKAYLLAWAGQIVICDRHPIEVLAIRPRRTRLSAHLEALVFRHLMPWPDVTVVLHAPGQVLFARKGDESPHVLERWRGRYLDTFVPEGAITISTVQPIDRTVAQASAILWDALKERRGW
jgi:thymidylate kinase